MIDLHSHTNESDGTCSPEQLIEEAVRAGVDILGITDHDTFAGYDFAREHARKAGVELICGIEEGWLSALKTTHFPLHEASSAHRAIESRGTQGKLALIP